MRGTGCVGMVAIAHVGKPREGILGLPTMALQVAPPVVILACIEACADEGGANQRWWQERYDSMSALTLGSIPSISHTPSINSTYLAYSSLGKRCLSPLILTEHGCCLRCCNGEVPRGLLVHRFPGIFVGDLGERVPVCVVGRHVEPWLSPAVDDGGILLKYQ